MSRELHDSTSQLLVALQLQLGELRRSRDPAAEPVLDAMATIIRDIHKSISQIGLEQSLEYDDAVDARIAVSRMFYPLGSRNQSAR